MKNKLLVCLLCLMASGCSLSFMYNNVDWWINWYLDDYVDLNRQQQKAFDEQLTELHKWHRRTQLVQYAEQAELLKQQVNEGITQEQLRAHFEQFRQHWSVFINKAAPKIAKLTTQLSDKQKQEFIEALKEEHQERLEDHDELPRDKWQKRRAKDIIEDLKEWFGKLTKSQKAKVTEFANNYQSTFKVWMDYRQSWQSEFFTLLSQQPDAIYEKALAELFIHGRSRLMSDEFKTLSDENNVIMYDIMHYQMNNLTKKQLKKFNRKMDNLIEDLIELSTE